MDFEASCCMVSVFPVRQPDVGPATAAVECLSGPAAGVETQDRVHRAGAEQAGQQRNQADPGPRRLIFRQDETESDGDQGKTHDHAKDPVNHSDIRSHGIYSL